MPEDRPQDPESQKTETQRKGKKKKIKNVQTQ